MLGIVRGHKGAIRIYSEKHQGSSFRILFPVGEGVEAPSLVEHETGPIWHGTGTVLLVDDENGILEIGKEMLEMLGFSVFTASNGREALEIYRENRNKITCIILDLTMPEMDGEEAYQKLADINPNAKVIMSADTTSKTSLTA